MKKLALGVIFSLFISLGPAVNAMALTSNGVEVNNLPDDDKKKKKKSCDSSKKEACTKEQMKNCKEGKKKSCCTGKTNEEPVK
jgi:hypothetical protein